MLRFVEITERKIARQHRDECREGQDVEDLEPPSDAADVTQPSEQG